MNKFLDKATRFFVIAIGLLLVADSAASSGIQPTVADLEIKVEECIEMIGLLQESEESPTVKSSLDYMLNLLRLIEGQFEVINVVREHGEP